MQREENLSRKRKKLPASDYCCGRRKKKLQSYVRGRIDMDLSSDWGRLRISDKIIMPDSNHLYKKLIN